MIAEPMPDIISEAKDQALEYARRICRSLPYRFDVRRGTFSKLISMFPFKTIPPPDAVIPGPSLSNFASESVVIANPTFAGLRRSHPLVCVR